MTSRRHSVCLSVFLSFTVVGCFDLTGQLEYQTAPWDRRSTELYLTHNVWHMYEWLMHDYVYANCTAKSLPTSIECSVRNSKYFDLRYDFKIPRDDIVEKDRNFELLSFYYSGFVHKMVFVKWLDLINDTISFARYSIFDLEYRKTFEITFPVDMSKNDPTFVNEIILNEERYFDIIISSKSACNGFDKCRIRYKYGDRVERDQKPVPIDANLQDIVFDKVNDDLYYLVGRDPVTREYRLMNMTLNKALTVAMTLNSDADWVSSKKYGAYTLCYTSEKGRKVDCIWFQSENRMHETIEFLEPVRLVKVEPMHKNTIALVTRLANCAGAGCQNLYLTKMHKRGLAENIKFKIDCQDDWNKVILNFHQYKKYLHVFCGCEKTDRDQVYFHVKYSYLPFPEDV